jgi:hypothetical protein
MVAENLRQGRFADSARGAAIGRGLQGSTKLPDTFTGKDTVRNLRPFKKFGMPVKPGQTKPLRMYKGKTDTQIENLAANAVIRKAIKKGSVTRRKLKTGINFKKYKRKEIQRARRVMSQDQPRRRALRQTRDARKHISLIRRNRRVMKTRLYSQNV